MTDFLAYILRSGLYMAIFYAFFLLVMRKTTFFRLNRMLLLAGTLVCLVLPIFRVRTEAISIGSGPLSMFFGGQASAKTATEAATESFSWTLPITLIFFAGMAVVIVCTVISSIRMVKLIKKGNLTFIDGQRTVVTNSSQPSFCFGKTIVIAKEDLDSNMAIFVHEKMHAKNLHFLDLLFFSLLLMFYWWNPLVWLTRGELCLMHEYEADEGVLDYGVEAREYQLLLVRKAVGDERFVLASGFQHSKLKNRIAMMLKEKSPGRLRWSYLAVLPLLSLAMYACNPAKAHAAVIEKENQDELVTFALVEKAKYHRGSISEFSAFVNDQLNYPEAAKDANIQGKVVTTFDVSTDGVISNIKVIRGVDPLLDEEATRAIADCAERWRFNRTDGSPLTMRCVFPIVFQLK